MYISLGAMSALTSLRNLNASIAETTNRIATTNRVNTAADAPAFWGAISSARSDVDTLRQVESSLGAGKGVLDVTTSAMSSIREGLEDMRDLLTQALPGGADRATLQSGIAAIQASVSNLAEGADFNGINLLTGAGGLANFQIVSGFNNNAVQTIDVTVADVRAIGATTAFLGAQEAGAIDGNNNTTVLTFTIGTIADVDASVEIGRAIGLVDAALNSMNGAELTVGVMGNLVDSQQRFNASMIAAKESAISSLVSADVEAEVSRLNSLQTQQQLAIEALSIANNNVSSLLGLFR
ncbi:MAG: flagellin [Pseudomonadota bacterium]